MCVYVDICRMQIFDGHLDGICMYVPIHVCDMYGVYCAVLILSPVGTCTFGFGIGR